MTIVAMRLVQSCALVALLCTVSDAGHAQPPAAPTVDTGALGPQVGAVVPAISAVDLTGRTPSLSALSGPKGLMLVFSRSADW